MRRDGNAESGHPAQPEPKGRGCVFIITDCLAMGVGQGNPTSGAIPQREEQQAGVILQVRDFVVFFRLDRIYDG